MGPHQKRSFREIILNESSLWVHLRWSACVLRSYFVRSGGQSTHKHNSNNSKHHIVDLHRAPLSTRATGLWWPVNDIKKQQTMHLFLTWTLTNAFKMVTCIIQRNAMDNTIYFRCGPGRLLVRPTLSRPLETRRIFLFVRCFYFNDEKDTETALDKHCFKYSLHELAFLFAFCELRQRDTQANGRTDDIQRNDDAMRSMA